MKPPIGVRRGITAILEQKSACSILAIPKGFVIPRLTVGNSDLINPNALELVTDLNTPKVNKTEEKMYFGPHKAPPLSQGRQQELNSAGCKQWFNYKPKEADQKFGGTAHEN